MSNRVFVKDIKLRLAIMTLCLGLAIVWVFLMTEGRLPFDRWMRSYWGDGFNPPSVNFMVYSLFVLFFCYCAFSILCESDNSIVGKCIESICFFGRNTLYIWLYHLVIKAFIVDIFPNLKEGSVLVRLLMFGLIVALPAIMKQLADTFLKYYIEHIDKQKNVEQQVKQGGRI